VTTTIVNTLTDSQKQTGKEQRTQIKRMRRMKTDLDPHKSVLSVSFALLAFILLHKNLACTQWLNLVRISGLLYSIFGWYFSGWATEHGLNEFSLSVL